MWERVWEWVLVLALEWASVEGGFPVEVSVEWEGAMAWPIGLNSHLGHSKLVVVWVRFVQVLGLGSVQVLALEGPLTQAALVLLARR